MNFCVFINVKIEPKPAPMADCGGTGHATFREAIARIYIICRWLPDSCKHLRRLQELSVLTRLAPQATLLTVVYGFGERVPLLIVTDTQ